MNFDFHQSNVIRPEFASNEELQLKKSMVGKISEYTVNWVMYCLREDVQILNLKLAVSASRLVKSPDSHASDPCSRLGGSSWLCYEKFISEFNEMPEIFWRHLA